MSNGKGKMSAAFLACLLLLAASASLSAESAKAKSKESSPKQSAKQSAVAAAKIDTAAPAEKSPPDPAICVKPGDAIAQAAVDEKSSAKPASDVQAEFESDSNTGYVKDKLRLSLGQKSAPDQPQQCGVDEAESQKQK